MTTTLYERIGGPGAVTAAVELFYARVWADPELTSFFSGVDRRRLKRHQREMLEQAMGGRQVYTGRSLAVAHAGLGITPAAFARTLDHLLSALKEVEVSRADRDAVAEALRAWRPDIETP